jgi:hypothetical protein
MEGVIVLTKHQREQRRIGLGAVLLVAVLAGAAFWAAVFFWWLQ